MNKDPGQGWYTIGRAGKDEFTPTPFSLCSQEKQNIAKREPCAYFLSCTEWDFFWGNISYFFIWVDGITFNESEVDICFIFYKVLFDTVDDRRIQSSY